jgi:hypothetical protein
MIQRKENKNLFFIYIEILLNEKININELENRYEITSITKIKLI